MSEDDEPRTMEGVWQKRLGDWIAARGGEWRINEWDREGEYYVEVFDGPFLKHRKLGRDRVDALKLMVTEVEHQK